MRILRNMTGLAVLLSAVPAASAVTYTVTTQTYLDFTNPTAPVSRPVVATFAYTAANFITADLTLLAAGLDFCTITVPAGATCAQVSYNGGSTAANDTVNFQFITGSTRFGPVYNFIDGAFGSYGTYQTITPAGQTATLIVSLAGAVPEPATWGMMLLGLGLVGAAARRRKPALFA